MDPQQVHAQSAAVVPRLSADLVLLHAPAFFDFRDRRDIYFPFLGTSGDVPITPLYEYFPVGFKTLQRFLSERGFDVKLMNLSTILLRYPRIDVDALFSALDSPVIGIDLHWMVHVQGSLAVAERIKRIQPDATVIFGGISSTYYAHELMRYPFVDMVMRGYDTHEPMLELLTATKGRGDLARVPNLLWKSADGAVRDNSFSHKPDTFACGIDWSQQPEAPDTGQVPIREFLSTQNAGCSYNCGWCGGSREAFRRVFERERAMARKPQCEVSYEFDTMRKLAGVEQYHFYSVGSYNESKKGMEFFLDRVAESGFKSISYEQFHLTPEPVLKRMVQANKRTMITLSPESHDMRVAKLSGRGVYTNDEMEAWLDRALDIGVSQVDVWYFIGMPEQDERSVQETVDYCHYLLGRFKGRRVNPMICPMIPFLDPASTFFEHPELHGYKVFHRTVEEHRRGMERASLINRINYETQWLSRRDLVKVGFNAVRRLMEAKAEMTVLPKGWVKEYNAKIDDALEFIDVVHAADCIDDTKARAQELDGLGDEIKRRNDMVFFSGVMNQAFPINRQIGGRWFDELGWDPEIL
ncbi:MAG: cobalamin-dependent protein, partial [Gemmatimonadaceae bacterium]